MFHTANTEDILKGLITDVYFQRTMQILQKKGINPRVKAEFIAKNLPGGWPWAIMSGLEEVLYLTSHLPVKVEAMREGTVFYPYEPVMVVEGLYQDFCVFETALLGLICQASGIATEAARLKKLAGKKWVVSFGARRMHPILAPMIERNAYIGGCDGVAVIKSGQMIGQDPTGTMPHALVLCLGSTAEAVRAYDETISPDVKRVALIDTFEDEKFGALIAAETLGEKLFAVRLDTPGSRRGNFYRILEEVRWELDLRGYCHVKLFVSGGIQEKDIPVLNPLVDAYGIGTAISNAPVVDYAMDIVEIDGKPVAKRGKCSGAKRVVCSESGKRAILSQSNTQQVNAEGEKWQELLVPVLENGKILIPTETPSQIRDRVMQQVAKLELTSH